MNSSEIKEELAVVESNIDSPSIASIRAHSNKMHGLSLLAMFMIEKKHEGAVVLINYDINKSVEFVAENLLSIWRNYKPSKSMIRSYRHNGVFLYELDGIKLSNKRNNLPGYEDFAVCKNIIDVDRKGMTYVFNIYRPNEQRPRTLTIQKEDGYSYLNSNSSNAVLDNSVNNNSSNANNGDCDNSNGDCVNDSCGDNGGGDSCGGSD